MGDGQMMDGTSPISEEASASHEWLLTIATTSIADAMRTVAMPHRPSKKLPCARSLSCCALKTLLPAFAR